MRLLYSKFRLAFVFIAIVTTPALSPHEAAAVPLDDIVIMRPGPAEDAYLRGMAAMRSGRLQKAEELFKESRHHDPDYVDPILGLAEVARLRQDAPMVEDLLQQAVQVDPESGDAYVAWARFHYAGGRTEKARDALMKAVKLAPETERAKLDLGVLLNRAFDAPEEAATYFDSVIEENPMHAGAHFGLGASLAAQGKNTSAQAEFEKAAELDPENPLPYDALGRLLYEQGEYERALQAFDRALEAEPRFVTAHVARGDILAAAGDLDGAAAAYAAAANTAPSYAPAYTRLGMAWQMLNEGDKAEEAYLAAIKADPENSIAYNNLASVAVERGDDLEKALEWAGKAVNLRPDSPRFLDTLAWVHRARGDLDEAADILKKAARMSAAPAVVHYHLGMIYEERGQTNEAIAALEKALSINNAFPEATAARELLKRLQP